eukprot:2621669-Alexandrium_andersonii.AAC.1
MAPASYRALTLMDHIAKAFLRCIQHHWQAPIRTALTNTQFGAGRFAGTGNAVQMLREWRDLMTSTQT